MSLPPLITCGILTVSDTCFIDPKKDTSGPKLEQMIKDKFPSYKITRDIAPDEHDSIVKKLNEWIIIECNLILTTGGTGFSPRDVTPEATRTVITREAPGLAYAITSKSLAITPMAMLSRAICGITNRTLIVNLPGSAKGAAECLSFIEDVIPHALAVIMGDTKSVARDHCQIQNQWGPSKVSTNNVADRPRESLYPMVEMPEAINLVTKESALPAITEIIPIEAALYRVLAENVLSPDNIPPFNASCKDGYAVRAADGAGPRRVRSSLAAGDSPTAVLLQSGEAIRVGTGAAIPAGADAVVQVEDTSLLRKSNGEELEIAVNKAPSVGLDIRQKGCDIHVDGVVLEKGVRLRSSHIGVLASVGKSRVKVYKPASVGVLTTGNELRNHNDVLVPGQIRDSNRLALIHLLKEYYYECKDFGIVKDEPNILKSAISAALLQTDVLITTGGVSMGEFDFVKRVLVEDFEATIHFGRVNMKPGKPTTFATLIFQGVKKIVFGLPGNPVSASVSCLLFVVPLLRYLEKCTVWQLPTLPYVVSTSKVNPDPRPDYVRVVLGFNNGGVEAKPNGGQISSRLNSMVGANGLMVMPGGMEPNQEYLSNIILIGDLNL